MDINNNLQINTFTKGMDTDSSDMYIGEGSYRYAENLRVVTDEDSNSGELHIIEGTNKVFDIKPLYEEVEYVDLGLPSGIKWAKCNLGANNPWNGGLYFSWGNVGGHEEDRYDFSPTTYDNTVGKLLNGNIPANSTYDAAISAKGEGCRIPTTAEFTELIENTTHEWVISYQNSGTNGMLFTASNGNSIFLPAVGYRLGTGNAIEKTTHGSYWASSYDSSEDEGFKLNISLGGVSCNSTGRYYGQTIRPVYDINSVSGILGYTSVRNYILVIVKKDNKWAIFKYDVKKNFAKTKVAGWFTEKIWPDDWNGKTKPLSLVTRWESDDNVKLYIATGETSVLSVNITKNEQGSDFDKIFGAEKITLTPAMARITELTGAVIPGVVIQYAYIVYKLNGTGTTLSMLSNSVVETINEVYGYKSEVNGEYVIEVTLPEMALDRYVRLYRIAYSKAGQLPRIDIIYDQLCTSNIVYDSGQSIQNVSSAEFIATNKLAIYPKEIESKGDYLFAANVKYIQDKIDAKFDAFDARCYSSGNYYEENGTRHNIGNNASEGTLLEIKNKNVDLQHDLFKTPDSDYNPSYWAQNSEGYNGRGLCFSWKYVYTENELYFENQYNSKITPRTYARNEVYRFGVRLFDMDGNPSSVKWIADIKMPDTNTVPYTVYSNKDHAIGIFIKNISIEFTPRNTTASYWENVSKYEIVLAKRSITDSYKIALGIVGFPMDAKNNELCLPYFLTTQYLKVMSGMTANVVVAALSKELLFNENTYELDRSIFLFASPEYTYQKDDILNILSRESGIYCKQVTAYIRDAYSYNYPSDETPDVRVSTYITKDVAPYSLTIDTKLNRSGLDLLYGLGAESGHKFIYLTQYIMVGPNQGGNRDQGPIGGSPYGAKKNTYFTNIYAEEEDLGFVATGSKNIISNITYVNAQDPEKFASGELPTYKSSFNILPHNSKKLFNWTNPAMINSVTYSMFRGESSGANEDTTIQSWKNLTMTSFDNERINWKTTTNSVTISDDWVNKDAAFGSAALTFPISPGGSIMALEFDSAPSVSNGPSDACPLITVANICRSTIPYGGYNINSINNTQYISGGYYNDKDGSTVISMGDNYITMFVYFLYHNFDNVQHDSVTSGAIQYIVPIESTIDLSKQSSEFLPATSRNQNMSTGKSTENTNLGIWVQAETNNVPNRFILAGDMYMYNTAYSITTDVITYSGQDTINRTSDLYDSRIHYSQKKQNNELIDNWTSFKTIDYLDVDSRYGQITGLKLFKDKLIFLQENGAGVLSVNDRIILKDQESANIIVGNGGVLDRYDYFTTIYGMKPNQHVVDASNDALYWWDGYRKEIIAYADGYNVNLLQRIKNVANYINKGTESATPSIVYDANNKEVLFNVVNDECITYNEQIQQFISVYTFNPIYYSNIDGKIYLTDQWVDREHLYEYNQYNEHDADGPKLFEEEHHPMLKYVVNKEPTFNKVFDIQTFGGRFYSGYVDELQLDYYTPLKQHSQIRNGEGITDREYDYRLAIPRNNDDIYGGRMRGKTMECVLTSSSNNKDFSIQYVTTKYRMSWT